jgi:hypothetical protein
MRRSTLTDYIATCNFFGHRNAHKLIDADTVLLAQALNTGANGSG